jgi:hypothetical protein
MTFSQLLVVIKFEIRGTEGIVFFLLGLRVKTVGFTQEFSEKWMRFSRAAVERLCE